MVSLHLQKVQNTHPPIQIHLPPLFSLIKTYLLTLNQRKVRLCLLIVHLKVIAARRKDRV
jgi:hypothetical protein